MSANSTNTSAGRVRVSVDPSRCAGHGVCLIYAKTIFDMDDEGYALVLHEALTESPDIESARRAELNCPERAINVEEEL